MKKKDIDFPKHLCLLGFVMQRAMALMSEDGYQKWRALEGKPSTETFEVGPAVCVSSTRDPECITGTIAQSRGCSSIHRNTHPPGYPSIVPCSLLLLEFITMPGARRTCRWNTINAFVDVTSLLIPPS